MIEGSYREVRFRRSDEWSEVAGGSLERRNDARVSLFPPLRVGVGWWLFVQS